MTCNKNIALLILAGITSLSLFGCQSQPYKPWQPGDSWHDEENQAETETQAAEAEKMKAAVQEMQAAPAPVAAEPEPTQAATPAVMKTEPVPVKPAVTRQTDSQPAHTPPPMVIRKKEPALASQTTTKNRTRGDVLLIDSIQSAPTTKTPRNGASMSSVRQQYGDPVSEGSGIGDPPITRWEYSGFSVYFEHDLVLHSVVRRPNQN